VAAFAAQRMPEEILLGQLHGKVTDDEIKDVLKQVLICTAYIGTLLTFSEGCKFSGNLVLGGNFQKFPLNTKYFW